MSMLTKLERANKGVAAVTANLNREISALKVRSSAGTLALAFVVLGRSNSRVPREDSVLFNSGYARKAQHNPMAAEVGYTAGYAAYVHESIEMKLKGKPRPYKGTGGAKARQRRAQSGKYNRRGGKGNYWDPGGEPKFLEKAVGESVKDGASIVASYAKIQDRKR